MADRKFLTERLTTRLFVGAGAIGNKTLEGVLPVLESEFVNGIIFGSMTIKEKPGNSNNVFQNERSFSINSIGLKNGGYEYYKAELPRIVEAAHAKGKMLIVSIAADTPEESAILTQLAIDSGADGAEWNGGCPNKWGKGGTQMEIPSFAFELMDNHLIAIGNTVGDRNDFIVGLKLSPYSNFADIPRVASKINSYSFVTYVANSNTFPNAYAENEQGQPLITPNDFNKNGVGGMAGSGFYPIAHGQVLQFRAVLRENIAIMGVGGICGPERGHRMRNYLKTADAVQVVTEFYKNEQNIRVFGDIYEESLEKS